MARFCTVILGAGLAAACGSDVASSAASGAGGDASGGNPSAGASGAGASGAATSGSGGNTASGGTPSNAGTPSGGTASGAGGKASAGGSSNASGGRASAGGSNNGSGGSSGTGGSGNTGGHMGSGGAAGAGGQAAAGGSAGSGGAPAGGLDHELLGVYCGNTPSDFTQFETWFAHHADGILGYTGNASWDDFDGSVGWATGNFGPLDRRVLWSVPLIPTGANLTDAAAGMYDDHYLKAAKTLAGFRTQESVLYIRTGWEFNGDWFPWAAKSKAKDFAGAFQHFVAAFRSVSSRFRFEWNVNVGDVGMNPEDAYPGDASVDIIGMDFYWNTQYDPKDPMDAWNSMMTRTYGLKWHQDFATAHNKPTAYSEWGVMSDAAGPYVQQAKAWFASHTVVYQTYWNSDDSFTGKLSSGQYPNAGAAYRAAFAP